MFRHQMQKWYKLIIRSVNPLWFLLKEYQKELLEYIGNLYPEIIRKLSEQKVLTEELEDKIVKAAEEFRDKSRC